MFVIGGEPRATKFDLNFPFFGIPVRVHPLFWLAALILGAMGAHGNDAGPQVAIWVVVMFVSILIHELGHAFTMRYFGEEPYVVLYMMGGMAVSGRSAWSSGFAGRNRTTMRQIIISAAGPAAQLVLAGIVIAIGIAFAVFSTQVAMAEGSMIPMPQGESAGNRYLGYLIWDLLFINIGWAVLNLLPVYPLDGGQIARSILIHFDPWNGMRYSLMLSIATGAGLAILSLALCGLGGLFMVFLFGSLAFSNWQIYQQITRGRRWNAVVTRDDERPKDAIPSRRVVLLGASNLVRGMTTIVDVARQVWGGPLDLLAAHGLGRSYGRNSRVIARTLPGIVSCGLWDALDDRPAAPTAALVTDIGNDILYGAGVEQIAAWVEQCLQRLAKQAQRTVITQLPLESIQRVPRWKFLMIRTLNFPGSRLRFAEAMERAELLNERVTELARRYRARVVPLDGDWYGFDPIHIRLRHWSQAWREILGAWSDDDSPRVETPFSAGKLSPARWL